MLYNITFLQWTVPHDFILKHFAKKNAGKDRKRAKYGDRAVKKAFR